MASLVGSRVERKEDTRFLQGKGRYTADINIANQTYAVFVRSPHVEILQTLRKFDLLYLYRQYISLFLVKILYLLFFLLLIQLNLPFFLFSFFFIYIFVAASFTAATIF